MAFGNCQPALAHRPHDVVSQIELSPNFSQDKTLYIIVRDNLFKSEHQGLQWQRLDGIDNSKNLTSLAISNSNGNVLFTASSGDGVYRSDDGGETWNKVNTGIQDLNIGLVAIAPDSADVVFAAGQEKGLYKTTNSGTSWVQSLPSTTVTAVAFAPNRQQVLLGDASGNLYRSDNLGDTWRKMTAISGAGAIQAIAPVPGSSTPDLIFIATEKGGVYTTQIDATSAQPETRGLTDKRIIDIEVVPGANGNYTVLASSWHGGYWQYKSTDKTWVAVSGGLTRDKMADDMAVPHFQDLEVSDAFNTDGIAFLGGFNGLFKTENAGSEWKEIESLSISSIIDLAISPNYANDSTLVVASYVQGLYISHDQGKTWKPMNSSLFEQRFKGKEDDGEEDQDPRRFFDIAFSPNYAADNQLFTSILWSKFLRSSDQGEKWSIVQMSEDVRGISILVSPNFANDQTIYLNNQQGVLFKSTNGGKSFEVANRLDKQSGNNAPSLAISPNFAVDQTLFTSGAKGVYQSVDAGKTWRVLTENTPLQDARNIQLALSPNYPNDNTVLVSTSRGLYITADNGKTWKPITYSALGEQPYVEAIAISPNYAQDQTFVISLRGKGLFRTTDKGQSFSQIGDRRISLSRVHGTPSAGQAVQFSPNYALDNTLYGFGSATSEIFKSVDGGDTWETLTIPRHSIGEPSFLQSIGLTLSLYAGTLVKGSVALLSAAAGYLIYRYFKVSRKQVLLKKRTS